MENITIDYCLMGENRMLKIEDEFYIKFPLAIEEHRDNLLLLRENLIKFRNQGMDKDLMLKCLESLREKNDSQIEDVLLELMDFVVGFCNPPLSIF